MRVNMMLCSTDVSVPMAPMMMSSQARTLTSVDRGVDGSIGSMTVTSAHQRFEGGLDNLRRATVSRDVEMGLVVEELGSIPESLVDVDDEHALAVAEVERGRPVSRRVALPP